MANDGYNGNSNLKRAGENLDLTLEQVQEFLKCSEDPVYFIQKYVKIVNVDRGLVPFDMYDFQREMVQNFHDHRYNIVKCPRQVGKTTVSAGYILWCVLFKENYNVAILANKGSLARDILERIKNSFEYLPKWLQQGIVEWNKGNILLENKSKISAHGTSSTGVRGGSYNLVFLDEFAFVPHNMAVEFFQATYPVISSGQTTKVIIVSTPNGLNLYYKMWMDAIEKRSTYNAFEIHWSDVPGRDEKWKEETLKNIGEEQFQQEFECEFLGSSATLISGMKLKTLAVRTPIESYEGFDIYKDPVRGHLYIATVDVAEGVGQDYSTINIIDVTNLPYVQVAKYRSNRIPLLHFPSVIYNISTKYNNAYVLVEINSIGLQVASTLHYDLEYENIFQFEHTRSGVTISAGAKRHTNLGLKMSKSTKKIGCAHLKTLIESDKLIVNDFDTINELTTFTRIGDSYAADIGSHDDLVMGLVSFGWMTVQPYFREATTIDIRKILQEESNGTLEQQIAPFGHIDRGIEEEVYFDGHDVWRDVNTNPEPLFTDYEDTPNKFPSWLM